MSANVCESYKKPNQNSNHIVVSYLLRHPRRNVDMVSRKRTSRFRVDTEAVKQPPWRPEQKLLTQQSTAPVAPAVQTTHKLRCFVLRC